MNKKKFFNFSIASVISFMVFMMPSYGQFGPVPGPSRQAKVKDAQTAKERTLLVVRTNNPGLDHKLEEVVNKYWKFNKNVSFTSEADLSQLLKGNETKYCVLTIQDITITERVGNLSYKSEFLRFAISLGENAGERKPLFYQNIAFKEDDKDFKMEKVFKKGKDYVLDLDKKEILFAMDYIQNHLIARTEEKNRSTFYLEAIENSGKLATKTLLIARQDLDAKTTEQDIQKNYPFKYKIVDSKEMEKIYLSRSKDFAFVEIVPFGYGRAIMLHYVVNCEYGQALSIGELFNGFGDRFSNFVNKDHLKAYVKNSNRNGKFFIAP